MERIGDAFVWPLRDPDWLPRMAVMGLTLLIPIVGAINGIGWMLANLDRLRAGEERLAPAGLGYIGRGARLFMVQLAYGLALLVVGLLLYAPALALQVSEGRGSANTVAILVAILLDLLAFGVITAGALAITFLTPAFVLATDSEGIIGGLAVGRVLRRARSNLSNTLIAGLMLIAASFVSSLGLLVCAVGVLFTGAYALAIQAWIFRSFEVGSEIAPETGS